MFVFFCPLAYAAIPFNFVDFPHARHSRNKFHSALAYSESCRDSSNLSDWAAFTSPLAYRPSSVATRHSSSGKPFGSALAAPSVHRQVQDVRGNRLLLRHRRAVRLGHHRAVLGFRPLPSRLGIAQTWFGSALAAPSVQHHGRIQLTEQILLHCLLFVVFCHNTYILLSFVTL